MEGRTAIFMAGPKMDSSLLLFVEMEMDMDLRLVDLLSVQTTSSCMLHSKVPPMYTRSGDKMVWTLAQ